MTSHKQLEQSLKRPDSFQDHLLKALQFVTQNKQRVAMMVTPIIVVAAIGYGIFGWKQHEATKRRAALASIIAMQTEEQNAVGKQREELQKQVDALRGLSKDDAQNLIKVTLLEKQMADLKPDTSKSLAAFKSFYDSHNDSPEGWMAGMAWAGGQLRDAQNADAKSDIKSDVKLTVRGVVEAIAKASTTNTFYQMSARFMLIGILEDAGDFDGGIKQCDILNSLVGDETKPTVLLAKGRLQYFKKSFAEARTALNEVVEKHGSSPEASKARSLMALMGPT